MPRTRLSAKYSEKPLPEIDFLKAAILERMALKGHKVNYESLAEKMDMSTPNLRRLMSEKRTEEWKPGQRRAACRALGLDEDRITMTAIYYRQQIK